MRQAGSWLAPSLRVSPIWAMFVTRIAYCDRRFSKARRVAKGMKSQCPTAYAVSPPPTCRSTLRADGNRAGAICISLPYGVVAPLPWSSRQPRQSRPILIFSAAAISAGTIPLERAGGIGVDMLSARATVGARLWLERLGARGSGGRAGLLRTRRRHYIISRGCRPLLGSASIMARRWFAKSRACAARRAWSILHGHREGDDGEGDDQNVVAQWERIGRESASASERAPRNPPHQRTFVP